MASSKQTTVGKRQGIADSNKVMFLWVAGASVVIGFALVFSWFLWQQIEFKTAVVNEKNKTVDVLKKNNQAVEVLRDDIKVLQTNAALESSKASPDQNAVQVILDALPADANELALGASLQERFIGPVDGVNLESLTVEPLGDSSELVVDEESGIEQVIKFTFEVKSTSADPLKNLLERFERSIRVIDIDTLQIERTGAKSYSLTVNGRAYYEPAKVIELRKEDFKREK